MCIVPLQFRDAIKSYKLQMLKYQPPRERRQIYIQYVLHGNLQNFKTTI